MALFLSKPILWNDQGYRRPSGVKANSGFPAEHGFGHEEWNNATRLSFTEDGVAYRAFHTEGVGNLDVAAAAGRIFVFMYASHDRVQELVGVAGCVTCLIDDKPARKQLADRLDLDGLAKDAWAVPRVRTCHGNDEKAFLKVWRHDLAWIPNWRCPADTFLWLDTPARLDPQALRGTGKLLTMFGRHTELGSAEALAMLDQIPTAGRSQPWHRIRAELEVSGDDLLAEELREIAARRDIPATTKQRLIDARIGQAGFRRAVETQWESACAVSGCANAAVLRASHIKAWSRSSDTERLDPHNGLLLTADLDALFDRGMISFADDGAMLLSAQLTKTDRTLFRLPRPLRKTPSAPQRRYLADHRRHWAMAR